MKKYRKRRQEAEVVEPIFGYGYASAAGGPGRIEKAVFVNARGELEEWDRVAFGREYERVEEKHPPSFVCEDCPRWVRLEADWHWLDGHSGSRVCGLCYKKRQGNMAKPSPLTLADLTPGDVFAFTDDQGGLTCERQVLDAEHYYSTPVRQVITAETDHARPVHFIRHHTLTPKQLLWVNATAEERGALEESIRDKGLPILRGEKRGRGHEDCPLCRMFRTTELQGSCATLCSGKGPMCLLWRGEQGGCAGMGYGPGIEKPRDPGSYRRARAFWANIARWLSDIHPLRIEVEATPVEWAGLSKAEGPGKK